MNNYRNREDYDIDDMMDEETLMESLNDHGKTLVHTDFFNDFEDDLDDEDDLINFATPVTNNNNNNNNNNNRK